MRGNMAYDLKTKTLLANLGINPDNDTQSILYAKITTALKSDPHDAKTINAELAALPALRDAALAEATKRYKLAVDPKNKKPIINESWDPNTLSWNFVLKIAADDPQFANREIKISVHNRAANNSLTPTQFNEAFEDKFLAAKTFYPQNKLYQQKILDLKAKFSKDIATVSKELLREPIDLKILVKKFNLIQQEFVANLAQAIYRATKDDQNYNPNIQEILTARDMLKRAEVEMLSMQPRPILMNIYFQDGVKPGRLQALLNIVEPLSDVSCDLRDEFINDKPANYSKVTNTIFYFDSNNNHTPGVSESFYRSSSLTLLRRGADVDDDDLVEDEDEEDLAEPAYAPLTPTPPKRVNTQKDLLEQQTQMLRKIIIGLYKDKLIKLYGQQSIINTKQPLHVYLSLNTLLSPTLTKKSGKIVSKAIPAVAGTFGIGNELEQLKAMRTLFDELDDQEINLSRDEQTEIAATISKVNPAVTLDRALKDINAIKLQPRLAYFNVSVVKLLTMRGKQIHIGVLDRTDYNTIHNEAGMKLHRRNIRDFIGAQFRTSSDTMPILELDGLFDEKIDHTNWKKLRPLFIDRNGKLKTESLKQFDPSVRNKLQNIIMSYIRLQDYIYGKTSLYDYLNPRKIFSTSDIDTDNNRITNGYMTAAASLFVMNHEMGIQNHITCKSGKDRTGLFGIIREALLDADSDVKLIENICNSLQHSSALTLNAMNVPGAKALQVDADILNGLKEIFGKKLIDASRIKEILESQKGRLVGGVGKKAYKIGAAARDLVKQQAPTDSSAEPIEIEKPNILNTKLTGLQIQTAATLQHMPSATAQRNAISTTAKIAEAAAKTTDTTSANNPPKINDRAHYVMQGAGAPMPLRHVERKTITKNDSSSSDEELTTVQQRIAALQKKGLTDKPKPHP